MESERHTLAAYLAVIRRRKWIILGAIVVTTASAVFFSVRQTKLYEANAEVLVNPDASIIASAGKSASDAQARFDTTQAQLAHTPAVTAIALRKAGVSGVTPNQLVSSSSVVSDNASNILRFGVTNHSAADATKLVNAYVDAFHTFGKNVNTAAIRQQIRTSSAELATITKQIDTAKANGQVPAGLRQQAASLVKKRAQYQEQLVAASSGARVVRYASGAGVVRPNPVRDGVLGLMLGAVIGLILAFIRESLDTRVRSSEDVARGTGLELLGRIPTPSKSLRSRGQLAMLTDPVQGEPYRKLRGAVDFANLETQAQTIMIASAVEREGKSTTVSNLAVAMAKSGRRVVLVDLDLRRPTIGSLFAIDEDTLGITDYVLGNADIETVLVPIVLSESRTDHAHDSTNGNGAWVPGTMLHVVPAGRGVPDVADFIESGALAVALDVFREWADIILIDTPPLLPVSDGVTLANKVDGILLVVKAELLRRPMMAEMNRLLTSCRATTLGFVLAGAEADGGYGYGYGYGYGGRSGYGEPGRPASKPASTDAAVAVVEPDGDAEAVTNRATAVATNGASAESGEAEVPDVVHAALARLRIKGTRLGAANLGGSAAPSAADAAGRRYRAPFRNGHLLRGKGRPATRRELMPRALTLGDVAALGVAFAISEIVLGRNVRPPDHVTLMEELALFALTIPLWVLVARIQGLYDGDVTRTNHSTADEAPALFHLVTTGVWILVVATWIAGVSRFNIPKFITFWILAFAAVVGFRLAVRAICRRSEAFTQRTVIVGAGDVGQLVARKINNHPEYGLEIVGFVDSDPRPLRGDIGQTEVLAPIASLRHVVKDKHVERVIVAFSSDSELDTLQSLRVLRDLPVQIDIVPRMFDVVGPSVDIHTIEGVALIGLPGVAIRRSAKLVKRTLDILGASLGLDSGRTDDRSRGRRNPGELTRPCDIPAGAPRTRSAPVCAVEVPNDAGARQ